MIKREVKNCETYDAPGHFKMTAMRIIGKEETGAEKFWMGLSHFLPGGGADYAYEDSPSEKVYHVLEGEITLYKKDKTEKMVLKKNDTVFIAPNEGRELINETNMPASMLVIVNY